MKKLRILICENFTPEYNKIIEKNSFDDVEIVSFPCLCGNKSEKSEAVDIVEKSISSEDDIYVICGRHCDILEHLPLSRSIELKTSSYCFNHLTSEQLINYIVSKGGYIISSGWLKHWNQNIYKAGFDQETARRFYKEICNELVFLDSGIYPELNFDIKELSDFLGLPYVIIPADIKLMEQVIESKVFAWRQQKKDEGYRNSIRELQTQCAEYAAVFDLFSRISSCLDYDEVIRKIKSIFLELFGARQFKFWPEDTYVIGLENQLKGLKLYDDDEYIVLKDKDRFSVKISRDSKLYGVIEASGFLFPEHIEKYLNFAIEISKISSLAFANVEQYERIKEFEEIRATDNAKKRFLASMSHEIRTPLNGILGMLQLLEMTELNEEQSEYAVTALKSTDLLLKLINDILDYSKIEANKIVIERIEFNLSQILKEITILYSLLLRNKELKIITNIDDGVPEMLIGDPYRIKQILSNLINNAIKFTTKGEINISVRLNKDNKYNEGRKLTVEFQVTDTGIGMPEFILNSIFDPFTQADSSTTRKYGGTGLGLAICKGLVEIMGGNIWVSSKEGIGSKFFFTVQLESAVDNK